MAQSRRNKTLKQRKEYTRLILEPAKTRIKNGQCPVCGLPKEKWTRRKDWRCCSKECTEKFFEHYIIYSWDEVRMKALKRDKFRCVQCGDDRKEVEMDVIRERIVNLQRYIDGKDKKMEMERRVVKEIRTNLIGDHILPIALGGEEFDIDNVQTLCWRCNKRKTRKDMRRINLARKKLNDENQTELKT